MYNYIPLLLWGAGRLVIKEIGRRNQLADQPMPADLEPSASAARLPSNDPRRLEEIEIYGTNAFSMAVGLMAKLAKVGRAPSREVNRTVKRIFVELGTEEETKAQATDLFQYAKDGTLTYSDLLGLFALHTVGCQEIRHDLVLMLLRVAHVNVVEPPRPAVHLIQNACTVLGLNYQQHLDTFQAWRRAVDAATQADTGQIKLAYEILGCSPADSDEQLRQRYRQLAREFHPDTIAVKGLSAEFTRFAEEKFKQIQAAYELIVMQR